MSKSDRNQEKVRKLSLLPENKECMDCRMRNTPYVVMDYCTFVCSVCSGVHRHFQHRVKGISMTNFKDEEVEKLKRGGNKKASSIWRATWNEKQYPKPKSYKDDQIKKFIRLTYEKKQWYDESGSGANRTQQDHDDDLPEVRPINEIIDEPIQIKIDRNSNGKRSNTKPAKQQSNNNNNGFDDDDDDWDVDFDNAAPAAQQQQQQQNDLNSFFGDPAPVQQQQQGAPQQQKPAKGNIDLDSLFGPSDNASPAGGGYNQQPQGGFNQGGFNQQPGGFGGNYNQQYPQQQQQGGFGGQQGGYNQQGYNQGGFNQQQGGFGGNYNQQYPQQQQGGYGGYNQQYPQQQQGMYNQQQQGGYGGNYNQQYPQQQQGGYGGNYNQQPQQQNGFSQQQQANNPFGGGDDSNPFGGAAPAQQQKPAPKKQEPAKPDPFQSLTSLGKSSLQSNSTPASGSSAAQTFDDDFPF